jgi:hypothetical protein
MVRLSAKYHGWDARALTLRGNQNDVVTHGADGDGGKQGRRLDAHSSGREHAHGIYQQPSDQGWEEIRHIGATRGYRGAGGKTRNAATLGTSTCSSGNPTWWKSGPLIKKYEVKTAARARLWKAD